MGNGDEVIQPWQLEFRQRLPLWMKEKYTEKRIKNWYNYWGGDVYVSFSGGKDSTVLLHQVRKVYPDVPAVFVDTGLEYPEIREFVKEQSGVIWLKPKMLFSEVIDVYGYPIVSKEIAQKIEEARNTKSKKLRYKRLYGDEKGNGAISEKWLYLVESDIKISAKCCNIMKKMPTKRFEKDSGLHPFVATMAVDSRLRKTSYLRHGCNQYASNRPMCTPMAFWLESDVWDYIDKYRADYSKIYDFGEERTGCMFCMFGVHLEKGKNKFQRMKKSHPKQYAYCIDKLGCGKALDLIGVDY